MRFSIIFPALLATVSARIIGLAAPGEAAPGSQVNLTLITAGYIQSVLDVSAAVGLSPNIYPDTLGTYLSSYYLGPTKSNIRTNITHPVTIPASQPLGKTNVNVAVTSLYGVSSQPVTTIFTLPLTVSKKPKGDLIDVIGGAESCSSTTISEGKQSLRRRQTPPGTLLTLIPAAQTNLTLLLSSIAQDNLSSAQTVYSDLSLPLNRIFSLANPSGSCGDLPSGRQLSKDEAIATVESVQQGLNAVLLAETDDNDVERAEQACEVNAAFFNSGLREYVFPRGGQ